MSLWMIPVAFGALSLLHTQLVHAAGIPASARHIPGLRVVARDLPVIPTACQVGCAPFAPFFGGESCPVTQCCSTLFEAGYFECFKCVGTSTNATDFSVAQEYVDVLMTSCIAEGFTLPVLTLPGQNPNRTLVSALPPGASAIPVFPAEGSGSVPHPDYRFAFAFAVGISLHLGSDIRSLESFVRERRVPERESPLQRFRLRPGTEHCYSPAHPDVLRVVP
ncbi:hypothetical protein DFH08DRAFT_6094 [Mycena albidolilacea]|uniref:Uncharacterized protein n=1 Tax=Mycena albidolilacea TaxID=1033008 RepID=A0AAD7ATP9_9AGAR|nr:hypothetical protein DFH08DRAFT_6094 [Mycena albidolilacea]